MRRQLVLVVEDDAHDREIYGQVLWYNGFDVLFARDGVEAVAMARAHQPDLVLLDLMIPRLDGLRVCRLLKEDPETAGIPVMVLSGRRRNEMEAAARAAGCCRYLEKPVSPVVALHEVEEQIGRAPLPTPELSEAVPGRRDDTVSVE